MKAGTNKRGQKGHIMCVEGKCSQRQDAGSWNAQPFLKDKSTATACPEGIAYAVVAAFVMRLLIRTVASLPFLHAAFVATAMGFGRSNCLRNKGCPANQCSKYDSP
jgi:hypothetical protein